MEDPSALVTKAHALVSSGEYAEALRTADQVLKADPSSYEALTVRGRAHYFLADYARASADYAEAQKLQPMALPAWEGLVDLALFTNKPQQALEHLQHASQLAQDAGNVSKQREYIWRQAELLDRRGDVKEAEALLQELLGLDLSRDQRLEALCFLADVQGKIEASRFNERVHETWNQQGSLAKGVRRTFSSVKLLVDAERADQQEVEGGLAETLKQIVSCTAPCPRFVRFHEAHLQRVLSRLGAYPPRSAARNEKRIQALRECQNMISTDAGCCTPFPFEAAIWLWEEREELSGGTVPVAGHIPLEVDQETNALHRRINWYRGDSMRGQKRDFVRMRASQSNLRTLDEDGADVPSKVVAKSEEFGMKLAHQFPWNAAAAVAVGLALRRRYLADPSAPSSLLRRKQITKCLRVGVLRGADSAAGWKALAELMYQNRQWQAAYDIAVKGLEWSVRRRRAGHETLTQFALALRLVAARCLRRLGRLDEAEYAFKTLAGWVTEGDAAFCELAGSPPLSIRQQAVRGIAKVLLARGDRPAAKAQYERILGKVLLGRGPPAEHWAHSEYAWLLFEDGDLANAKYHLEMAIRVAEKEGCAVTDSEIAEHHYRLGRICWTMGGSLKTDPKHTWHHFEAAALEEGDVQSSACEWLGHWYKEVALDYHKAINCYHKALEIDPDNAIAKNCLETLQEQEIKENLPDEPSDTPRLPSDILPSPFASAKAPVAVGLEPEYRRESVQMERWLS